MARPSTLLATSGPATMLDNTDLINDWFSSIKNTWAGATAPPSPVAHQFWMDTSSTPATLKIYDGTAWQLFGFGGFNFALLQVPSFDSVAVLGKSVFRNIPGTTTGTPLTSAGWICTQDRIDSGNAVQTAARNASNDVRWRRQSGGTWQPWQRQLLNDQIVGTVSQSGGVPTGSVFESGLVLLNGEVNYTKFASGLAIQTWQSSFTYDVTTASGSIFRSATHTLGFSGGLTFLYPPVRSISVDDPDCWGNITNSGVVRLYSSISQTGVSYSVTEIGRWS